MDRYVAMIPLLVSAFMSRSVARLMVLEIIGQYCLLLIYYDTGLIYD